MVAARFGPHPILVNRRVVVRFMAVADELSRQELMDEVKVILSYSPRHMLHDASRPISMHAYGLAVDVNPAENRYATAGSMHPGIIKAFEAQGFTYGGRWRVSDPMHFQAAKL